MKEDPWCYRQGRRQLRVSSPLLWASEQVMTLNTLKTETCAKFNFKKYFFSYYLQIMKAIKSTKIKNKRSYNADISKTKQEAMGPIAYLINIGNCYNKSS